MDAVLLTVFALVYLGMILGGLPGLKLDRAGVALLGAIALLAFGRLDLASAWQMMDSSTLALLFGLMVVSAQLRMGGFYDQVTRRLAALEVAPPTLLLYLVATAGGLAALLTNDIICLAMAPMLIEGCTRRGLHPLPFLLALACATNVGSAATLIGNPQNMLIGQRLGLDFTEYLLAAAVPSALGLVAVWAVIAWQWRGRWQLARAPAHAATVPYDAWQSTKGLLVLAALAGLFVSSNLPREVLALGAAGLLLCSRKLASREFLGLVDWSLLVLFAGLFVVNGALQHSGMLERFLQAARKRGLDPAHPLSLGVASVVGSNLVSNVPCVMLLLPSATHCLAGPVLGLTSTLAGNLLLVGSIANLIVADQAGRLGIAFGWREHARTGVPVTLLTLAIAVAWLIVWAAWHPC